MIKQHALLFSFVFTLHAASAMHHDKQPVQSVALLLGQDSSTQTFAQQRKIFNEKLLKLVEEQNLEKISEWVTALCKANDAWDVIGRIPVDHAYAIRKELRSKIKQGQEELKTNYRTAREIYSQLDINSQHVVADSDDSNSYTDSSDEDSNNGTKKESPDPADSAPHPFDLPPRQWRQIELDIPRIPTPELVHTLRTDGFGFSPEDAEQIAQILEAQEPNEK